MLDSKIIFENIMKDLLKLYDLPKDYSSALYYLVKKYKNLSFNLDKDTLISIMTRAEISCTAIKCLKDLSKINLFIKEFDNNKMTLSDAIYKVYQAVKNDKTVSIIIQYEGDTKITKLEYEIDE